MKDLSNENVIHVKKDGIEYLQFRKLLEYSDIVKHAYAIGLDKNFRTARAKNATPLTPEEYEKAVNDYKNLANFIGIDYINIVGGIVHMKIGLASDHGGYNLKSEIIKHLKEKGIECIDFGPDNSLESVDYPIFGEKVANAVISKAVDYGIVCCGTGIGISLAANKVPGIRCAVVSDVFSAKMSKAHNDANMLSLGERVLGRGLALEIVDAWINTEFEGDRHSKRVNMIKEIEERYNK